MNRRALLIITLAALFGLGMPLCAFACQDDSSSPQVASAHSPEGASPCHGGAPSSPEELPGDGACDCDGFEALLSKGDSSKAHRFLDGAALTPPLASLVVPPSESSLARFWQRPQDLPPPDILLLKSTLLV